MRLTREHFEMKFEVYRAFLSVEIGAIVAAACLMHDIGNPPFGHAGEGAIQEWFTRSPLGRSILERLTLAQRRDFDRFEGNAQGFRTVCRLQNLEAHGGMQLTCATLAAFAKYPTASSVAGTQSGISARKHGFVTEDRQLFEDLACEVGLRARAGCDGAWYRHPLAFLVEAADDICYRVIDVEDGLRTGSVPYSELQPLFFAVIDPDRRERALKIGSEEKRIEYLRAKVINVFVMEVADAFAARSEALLKGDFDAQLISAIPHSAELKAFETLGIAKVYRSAPVLENELPGSGVLGSLLDALVGAVNNVAERGPMAAMKAQALVKLIPSQFSRG